MKLIYKLISRSTLIALCAISFTMFSCEGDEGAIGPKGDLGAQGPQGEQGQQGESPGKMGYFEGTITGTRQDETPFTETFKYEYTYDPIQVITEDSESIWFERMLMQSYSEGNPARLNINGYYETNDADELVLIPYRFDFSFFKEINSSTLFVFYAEYDDNETSSEFEMTNFVHNPTTGIITFDFSFIDETGYDNSTNNPVTITGKYNSGNKVYTGVSQRKG